MNYERLKYFLNSLTKVDIYYWRHTNKSLIHIIPLLLAGGMLITFSRAIFFGFDNAMISMIASFTGFLILCVSCGAALLRKGAKIPNEIYALAHTISINWLLALTLLAPSIIHSLRWFDSIGLNSYIPAAAFYSLVSTLILLKRSLQNDLPKPSWLVRIVTPFFIFIMTTIFVYVIVMDEKTDSFFRDSTQSILETMGINDNRPE